MAQGFIEVVRKIPTERKVCPQCGKKFVGPKVRRYCSDSCRKKAVYHAHKEQYRQARRERYRGQKKQAAKKS